MSKKILLTSFQTWLPHQTSNSSDDLLLKIQKEEYFEAYLTFLRQLPVNIEQASEKAIAAIDQIKPDVVIYYGMTEKRDRLSVEQNAE